MNVKQTVKELDKPKKMSSNHAQTPRNFFNSLMKMMEIFSQHDESGFASLTSVSNALLLASPLPQILDLPLIFGKQSSYILIADTNMFQYLQLKRMKAVEEERDALMRGLQAVKRYN